MPAVERALRVLEALERGERPMTISELARALSINKGTMRDLLETLRARGILERDEERKQYRLGPRLARLGMAALGQLDLARVANPYMVELAQQTGGAVLLLMRDGDRATIVDKVDAGQVAVEVSATIGRRIPLAAGASGKVLMSESGAEDRQTYLGRLPKLTARTIYDPDRFTVEVDQVHRRGYAIDDEEYLAGVRATGAPVHDARGRLIACVLVVGLTSSLSADELRATGEATALVGRSISAALGAPPRD